MLTKALILGSALVSTPLLFVSQGGGTPQGGGVPLPDRGAVHRLQDDGKLDAIRTELRKAREDVRDLRNQLEEALDLLDETIQPRREGRRNCTPSRASLVYYQWLKQRNHGPRAERTMERFVEGVGDDRRRLISLARELMIDDDHAGRFDQAAFALVQRANKSKGKVSHRDLDTAALAHFLNGDFTGAVALQGRASKQSRGSDEYRRRLRTYQTALAKTGSDSSLGEAELRVAAAGGD